MILLACIQGLMLYLALEDCVYCTVDIPSWALLHICIVIWKPWLIVFAPILGILYYKGPVGIGMGDWVFAVNLLFCKDLVWFGAVFSIYSLLLMVNNRTPGLFPLFLAGLIT